MSLRTLTILTTDDDDNQETLKVLENEPDIVEFWSGKARGQKHEINVLASAENLQALVDKLQRQFGKKQGWRMIISPVETTIPRYENKESDRENTDTKKTYGSLTREALYDQILQGTKPSTDFIILVFLSTIVTAIGLVTSNLAVIIGAMVIAPLLGPNLALSFGVTLGDKDMTSEALKANAIGFGLTMALSMLAGLFIPYEIFAESHEYIQRTTVGYDGVILAFASGAAAVLSLTAGISSAMVGVMVAVALMPPAVALGLALGAGAFPEAYGAGLLLAINIICVNIAAKSVFTFKGIRPRTWYQRKKSKQSLKISLGFWSILLLVLMMLIYLWGA
jgi:uncharacterized hydrophobic protein (TIGR00341 family)